MNKEKGQISYKMGDKAKMENVEHELLPMKIEEPPFK